MKQFAQDLNTFMLQKPETAAFLGPWFFVALPLLFTPHGIWEWPLVQNFMDTVSAWAPMIDRFSKYAETPGRMRFVLACAWASGPVVTLFAGVMLFRAFAHGTRKRRESNYRATFVAILFCGGLVLLFSHGGVHHGSKLLRAALFSFSSGYGFTVVGWAVITTNFAVLGIALGATVDWIKQDLS